MDEKVLARYSVEKGHWTGEPILTLHDRESGAEATITPGLGANCVAWAVTQNGQRIEVLETPPNADDLRTRRFRAGIPVLWPFPGRVREAQYTFAGHTYHLPRTDKGGVHRGRDAPQSSEIQIYATEPTSLSQSWI